MTLPTVAPGFDFSAQANINAIIDAMRGRSWALGGDYTLAPAYPSIGDLAIPLVRQMQAFVHDYASGFVNSDIALADVTLLSLPRGDTPSNWFANVADVNDPTTAPDWTNDTGLTDFFAWCGLTAAANGAYSFVRKRPAEINSTTATAYMDLCNDPANTPASGDVAYLVDSTSADDGQKFQLIAGVWTKLPNQFSDRPRVIAGHGPITTGDYIGEWIFTEILQCLRKMTRTLVTGDGVAGLPEKRFYAFTTSSVSVAAAQAAALASVVDFGSSNPSGLYNIRPSCTMYWNAQPADNYYYAGLFYERNTFSVISYLDTAPYPRNFTWGQYTLGAFSYPEAYPSGVPRFDKLGFTSVANVGNMTVLGTAAAAAAASIAGSVPIFPPEGDTLTSGQWPATTGSSGGNSDGLGGFQLQGFYTVDWDFGD